MNSTRIAKSGVNRASASSCGSCAQLLGQGVASVLALALAACSEIPLLSNPTERTAARLEIQLDGALYTGERAPLRWHLYDQNDEPIDMLPGWLVPEWSATQPLVRLDGDRLEVLRSGETTLTLELGGASATQILRINPGALNVNVEAAYITQVVQRRDGSVPLVAGRPGYLRVFVTGDQLNYFRPTVRARFFNNGVETATLSSNSSGTGIPRILSEGSMAMSWNMPVPGTLITPGTSMLIELDTDSGLRPAAQSVMKFPASGVARALDVRIIAPFRITFVPINIIGFAMGNVTTANVDYYMSASRQVWPFQETDVVVREPYSTTTRSLTDDDWSDLLLEIRLLRAADGSSRYYHGILRREGAWSGLGYVGFPAAITQDGNTTWTVAHELGHNFGRRHAPCGGPSGVDANYPHANGGIGVYGLESNGTTLHPPTRPDLMTYCSPRWVSDYSYVGVVSRLQVASSPLVGEQAFATGPSATDATDATDATYATPYEGAVPSTAVDAALQPQPQPGTKLMVAGEVGSPRARLSPAFTIETVPSLPSRPGPYTLEGRDGNGAIVFSISFAGEALGDGPVGARHFAFAIPISPVELAQLSSLRVHGAGVDVTRSATASGAVVAAQPGVTAAAVNAVRAAGGLVSLTWDASRYPLIVVRNPASGSLLAMVKGGLASVRTSSTVLEVTLSDGVRSFVDTVTVR